MSTTEEAIRVKLLDAKKAETELRKVRKELEDTTGTTSGHTKASEHQSKAVDKVHHSFSKFRTAFNYGGGLLGLGAVGYGLKDLVQGGIRANEQQELLQAALRATGRTGEQHLGKVNRAIEESGAHGGFGVVEETQGVAQLVRVTGSYEKALKLNNSAVQLARGTHLDYATSLKMVAQIQTGNTGRLQKYLGIIQPVTSHVDALKKSTKAGNEAVKEQIQLYKLAHPGVTILGSAMKEVNKQALEHAKLLDKEATAQKAQEAIAKKYGTTVTTYNKTAAGAISNANNAFKAATEELGQKLLPAVTDVAKGFGSLVTEIAHGEGIWKTVGHDLSDVAEDAKDVWQFFEKNKWALKGLETVLVAGGTLAAFEKLSKISQTFRGLSIVKAFAGLGPTLAAEDGAVTLAGTTMGGLWAGAFTVAAGAEIGLWLSKELPNGLFGSPEPSSKHAEGTLAGQGKGTYLRRNSDGTYEVAPKHGFEHTRAGGKAASGPLTPAEAATVSRFLEHPHSESGLTSREIALIEKAFERAGKQPVNLYLDGKLLAHTVGDHAIRQEPIARKFAEATTKHVQSKNARGSGGR
jgi:hypothetical protein